MLNKNLTNNVPVLEISRKLGEEAKVEGVEFRHINSGVELGQAIADVLGVDSEQPIFLEKQMGVNNATLRLNGGELVRSVKIDIRNGPKDVAWREWRQENGSSQRVVDEDSYAVQEYTKPSGEKGRSIIVFHYGGKDELNEVTRFTRYEEPKSE